MRLWRIGRLLGYGLLGLVGRLLVLLASGATYEAIANRQAARRYRARVSSSMWAAIGCTFTALGRAALQWSRGKQIMVANTDHMIPLEQPEAVIAELPDVIDQARKSLH